MSARFRHIKLNHRYLEVEVPIYKSFSFVYNIKTFTNA